MGVSLLEKTGGGYGLPIGLPNGLPIGIPIGYLLSCVESGYGI